MGKKYERLVWDMQEALQQLWDRLAIEEVRGKKKGKGKKKPVAERIVEGLKELEEKGARGRTRILLSLTPNQAQAVHDLLNHTARGSAQNSPRKFTDVVVALLKSHVRYTDDNDSVFTPGGAFQHFDNIPPGRYEPEGE